MNSIPPKNLRKSPSSPAVTPAVAAPRHPRLFLPRRKFCKLSHQKNQRAAHKAARFFNYGASRNVAVTVHQNFLQIASCQGEQDFQIASVIRNDNPQYLISQITGVRLNRI
jgi:hypothetical protein